MTVQTIYSIRYKFNLNQQIEFVILSHSLSKIINQKIYIFKIKISKRENKELPLRRF